MDLKTEADRLSHDPRIAESKRLLLEAVADHQKAITGIRPANPALKTQYAERLEAFAKSRGAKLYFPYIGSGFGKGPFVELCDGSVKYDFISGIGPHVLGHNHPCLLDAGIDAAISDITMQGNLQQNQDAETLLKELVKLSKLPHCFLTTAGAMANENALKIAFQARFPASRILAFDHCFAGRTLATSQITDKPAFRDGLPLNLQVDYIPFYDPGKPEQSTNEAVNALKKYLVRYPRQHAVMIFELVQGEGGFYTAPREFFISLMEIAKDNGIAVFADEIQSFGRTPELFAFHYLKLEEYVDLAAIGKLSQICATFYTDKIAPRPGLLSQTFTGSTAAIKASLAILNELVTGNYFGPKGKNQQIFDRFSKNLQGISERHRGILQGPFGIGSMIAFTPFLGDATKAAQMTFDLFEEGVITFIAGSHPTRLRMLIPAGAVTKEDIDAVCAIIEKTLLKANL